MGDITYFLPAAALCKRYFYQIDGEQFLNRREQSSCLQFICFRPAV
jgi:hypothetical protein